MKFDASLAGFILSLVVAASGWFFRWNDKQKFERQQAAIERQQAIRQAEAAAEKKVNDERNLNHLLGNQKQITDGIATGFRDIERELAHIREQIGELKAYLIQNQNTVRGE